MASFFPVHASKIYVQDPLPPRRSQDKIKYLLCVKKTLNKNNKKEEKIVLVKLRTLSGSALK